MDENRGPTVGLARPKARGMKAALRDAFDLALKSYDSSGRSSGTAGLISAQKMVQVA